MSDSIVQRLAKYEVYRLQKYTVAVAAEEEDYEPRFYDMSNETDRLTVQQTGIDVIDVHWCLRGGIEGEFGPVLFHSAVFNNVAQVYARITGFPVPKLEGDWVGVLDLRAS